MTELQSILESLPEHGSVNRSATFFQWAWKHFCKFFKPRFNLHFQIYRYNLHVIYLARDPRGILNSVRALPSQWPTRLLSPLHICSRYLPSPDLYTDMRFLWAIFSKGYSTTPSTYPLTISPRSVEEKFLWNWGLAISQNLRWDSTLTKHTVHCDDRVGPKSDKFFVFALSTSRELKKNDAFVNSFIMQMRVVWFFAKSLTNQRWRLEHTNQS